MEESPSSLNSNLGPELVKKLLHFMGPKKFMTLLLTTAKHVQCDIA